MKNIEVVAAVIIKNRKILAAKRGYGEFKGKWEFPGGKIKENESKKEALKREIKEELNTDIKNLKYLTTVNYNYPTFHLTMHTYVCDLDGNIEYVKHNEEELEYDEMVWLEQSELDEVDWLPADIEVVNSYKALKGVIL